MISPKAIHLIIKHFDAIDKAVSKRLNRKRPWSEPALTSLLCDLMDQETQTDEKIEYSIENLNDELEKIDGLLDVSFVIETHEYTPRVERWVTQSDLGFVINFEDHLLPDKSWSISWLLQAKKLFPDNQKSSKYSEVSRFQSYDPKQADRIKKLEERIGIEFIKYLFFCPRPSDLDDIIQKKLTHLRNRHLSSNIFDFTLGLELRDELSRIDSSLAAGIFISRIENYPRTLGAVHEEILGSTFPFSWFIASHFAGRGFEVHEGKSCHGRRPLKKSKRGIDENDSNKEEIAEAIVRGDEKIVKHIIELMGGNIESEFQILPPHTITVNVGIGSKLNSNLRQIRKG